MLSSQPKIRCFDFISLIAFVSELRSRF